MFRNRFLLIPFVIFLISFGIDKLISSTIFEPYYSLSLSDLNFKHKEFLFEELKDYLKKRTVKKFWFILEIPEHFYLEMII
ncbi:PF07611 domain protein [Leptospira interrogans serovar Icterohaemorrhagiae str. Verdun HP]|uniref:PF07611 domain protein n=2 Tax=Leptospira interrogans TaxID=173 RepID=M3I0R1_LEPIR|nr:PF07611 domain protein [Leptospira interrogans serovar Grippotyphosa str. LT2186]EMO04200.1 PF07611 domain protein [Leptospira interrogans serovar Icterohaemorrhagiae str. Verdun HP]